MTQQLTKDSFKSNGKSILAVDFFNFRILFMNIWSLSHFLSDCSIFITRGGLEDFGCVIKIYLIPHKVL